MMSGVAISLGVVDKLRIYRCVTRVVLFGRRRAPLLIDKPYFHESRAAHINTDVPWGHRSPILSHHKSVLCTYSLHYLYNVWQR